jgi:hypothetical protein
MAAQLTRMANQHVRPHGLIFQRVAFYQIAVRLFAGISRISALLDQDAFKDRRYCELLAACLATPVKSLSGARRRPCNNPNPMNPCGP